MAAGSAKSGKGLPSEIGVLRGRDFEPIVFNRDAFFPVQEWKNHPGGPLRAPYFLQDQLYNINVNLAEMPTDKAKVDASISITNSSGNALTDSKITIRDLTKA
ncbi:MAG: hypothetical protein H7318_16640 [Oligoflexus sp.]|nr:hypothetical protein [Oligoflexus sp.]